MDEEDSSLSSPDMPPRVTLPSDLSGSLKSLDDAQLQRLRDAVSAEMNRRTRAATSTDLPAGKRNNKVRGPDEIPAGKVNLIRASFKAGLKPLAIARTLRISQSLVRRVLSSEERYGKSTAGNAPRED
jgi:DNA invertase Pin-like site-specific DNA recombinase